MYRCHDGHQYYFGAETRGSSAVRPNDKVTLDFDMDAGTLTYYVNGAVQPHPMKNLQGKVLYPAVQFHSESSRVSSVELTSVVVESTGKELQVGGTHFFALRLISEMVKGGAKTGLSREVLSAFLRVFVSGGMLGSVLEIFESAGKEYRAAAAECALSFVQPAVARAVLCASLASIGTAEASAQVATAAAASGGGDRDVTAASVSGAADGVHESDALEMCSVHELVVAKCHVLHSISLALELGEAAGKNLDALKAVLGREGGLLSIVVSRVHRIEDFWSVSLVNCEGKPRLPAEAESSSTKSATLLQLSRSLMKAVCTLVSLMDDAALMSVSFADMGIAVSSLAVRNLVWICSNDVLVDAVDPKFIVPTSKRDAESRFTVMSWRLDEQLDLAMVDRSRYFAARMLHAAVAPALFTSSMSALSSAGGVVEDSSASWVHAQVYIATMPEGLQRLVWSKALDLTCQHLKSRVVAKPTRPEPRRGHRKFGRRSELIDNDVGHGNGTLREAAGGGVGVARGVGGSGVASLKSPTAKDAALAPRGGVKAAMATGVSLVTLSQLVASLLLQVFSPAALLQALRSFVSSTSGSVVSSRRHEAGFGLRDSGTGGGAGTSRAGGNASQGRASAATSAVLHHNAQGLTPPVTCASYVIDDSAEPDSLAIALPGLLSVVAAIDDLVIRTTTPGLTVKSMVALSESKSDPVVGPWCRQLVESDALALCLQWFITINQEQSRLVGALKDKGNDGRDTEAVQERSKDGGGGEGKGMVLVEAVTTDVGPWSASANSVAEKLKLAVAVIGRLAGWVRNKDLFGGFPLSDYYPLQRNQRRSDVVDTLLQLADHVHTSQASDMFTFHNETAVAMAVSGDFSKVTSTARELNVAWRSRCCVRRDGVGVRVGEGRRGAVGGVSERSTLRHVHRPWFQRARSSVGQLL
jgi:hypothetical protein